MTKSLELVVAGCALLLSLPEVGRPSAQDKPTEAINPNAAIVEDFEQRVTEYQKLHKKAESELPRLKRTPSQEKIQHHQHELAHKIREARRGAREGDIFTVAISAEFRRLIGIAMRGQNAARVEESLKSAEPVKLRLRVNEAYPSGVPLQSTPPTLLLNLPKLPQEVEYRVAGHDLVLLDVKAKLIVDVVPSAVP